MDTGRSGENTRFVVTDAEIRQQAERISANLGKSELYPKLLTYLVDRTLRGNPPKELDIAIDVFGKDETYYSSDDALVRVYMHSLRGKIKDFYAGEGRGDAICLAIPKGSYKVTAERQETSGHTDAVKGFAKAAHPYWRVGVAAFLAGGVVTLLVTPGLMNWTAPADPLQPLRETVVWSDIYTSDRPLTIILGDLLFFSELDDATGRNRIVRDPNVNSGDDLDALLSRKLPQGSVNGEVVTTMVPKSPALGLARILPLLYRPGRSIKVVLLDELDLVDVRQNDIVYIGPLVRLGPLGELYFQQSQYSYDRNSFVLTNTRSDESYQYSGSGTSPQTDYGLFAKFSGPTDNIVMIFGSVARDLGLLQIVRSLTTETGIREISGDQPGRHFEALYAAHGYGRTDLTAEIVQVDSLASPTQAAVGE